MSDVLNIEERAAIDIRNDLDALLREPNLRTALDAAIETCNRAIAIEYRTGHAFALRNSGAIRRLLGELPQASADLQTAIDLMRKEGDLAGEGGTYLELGILFNENGAPDIAMENFLRALWCFQSCGDQHGQARSYNNMGIIYGMIGQFDESLKYFSAASTIYRQAGYQLGLARAISNIGGVCGKQGKYEEALSRIYETLGIYENFGLKLDIAISRSNIGNYLLDLGRLEEARQYYEAALDLAREVGHVVAIESATLGLGRILAQSNEPSDLQIAEQHLDEVYRSASNGGGGMRHLMEVLGHLITLHTRTGNYQQAYARTQEILDLKKRSETSHTAAAIALRISSLEREREKHSDSVEIRDRNHALERDNTTFRSLIEQKDEVLRTVSHDMRSYVSNILGASDIIRTEGRDDAKTLATMTSIMTDSGRHLMTLLDNILEIAQAESGAFSLRFESISLSEVLTKIVQDFQLQASKKSISLSCYCLDDTEINADRSKIFEVFGNLVSNAIKFTNNGGTIRMLCEVIDGRVHVHVRDNGIGIPEENIPKIFEKFGKHQRRGTGGEKGTGLGMPIVKRFVELHGGTVAVASKQGSGTTITVELPLAPVR